MSEVTFRQPLQPAIFVRRVNRFAAQVKKLSGKESLVHVPNSGRLAELLGPGTRVLVAEGEKHGRKTAGELILVREKESGRWVCIDSRLPGKLVEGLIVGRNTNVPFTGWEVLRREPAYGRGRFDLLLKSGDERCLVEAKSVTLVKNGTALFPDTPTARGRKHMEELVQAGQKGYRIAVFFIVQREDALRFSPNFQQDPSFYEALKQACLIGLEVYALKCRVSPRGIAVDEPLPVVLNLLAF